MVIDFGRLTSAGTADTVLHPREIFTALPQKKEGRFEYPRDVQSQVWDAWFKRRDENDLVVKMNTGTGKTVVGLLILKSCLNENKGPAVYIAPDNYLVAQVLAEANDLGVEATDNIKSTRFLSGKAILVINIHKLVNGKSVFGVGDEGIKIKIGSLLIDDAHACLDTIEDQFMLSINKLCGAYVELYDNFREALHNQCESKAIEIEIGDPSAYIQLPFWTWQENIAEISKIIIKHKDTDEIKFSWPLIKESLSLCRCVISADKIEISPHCIPIHMIPSVVNAPRKLFMTATLVDDGILATHFGITEDSINKAVMPDSAGDIGDRMILLPQVINTEITDLAIKDFCKHAAKYYNVVVIVPSDYRSHFWSDQADLILKKDNIHAGIERLKNEKVGLVILVNRYDGIDLPKNACRLLVIDGLPDVRRQIDKVNQSVLMGSDRVTSQIIQRIEQGMGRGIRSNDDFCAVFLMGKNLTGQLYAGGAVEKFSPGTKAQLELSEKLSEQIQGKGLREIWDAILLCLKRDTEWVTASKGAVASLTYHSAFTADKVAIETRKSYDLASCNNFPMAAKELSSLVNETSDRPFKGYLKQCLAEYINFYDKVESQKTLMSAVSINRRVLKPLEGIAYHKLESAAMDQSRVCSEYLKSRHKDPNKIIIEINGILELLLFKPDTSNIFEESFRKLANYIGFNSQRPELEFKKGPDVLWETGALNYFVIECKNGATTKSINKHDCNQLNGSAMWFESKYDISCTYTPIIIHPSSIFEHAASPHKKTRIIDSNCLDKLKENILEFIKAICIDNSIHNIDKIREMLIFYKLRPHEILETFTIEFKVK